MKNCKIKATAYKKGVLIRLVHFEPEFTLRAVLPNQDVKGV